MKVSFMTDTGKVRSSNEDSLLLDEDIGLFIVADGMGGHQAGEVASEIAVNVISSSIKETLSRHSATAIPSGFKNRNGGLNALIKESVLRVNAEILGKSRENILLKGMGTTVVLALLDNAKFHIANVGDSRAYLIRNNKIKQLTEDHSKVAELVKWGIITKEEARVHPERNILTRALGMAKVDADIKTINIKVGDYMLLCTDGLTDMLMDEEIRGIIVSPDGSLDEKCRKLINQANAKGGRDNITAVLISWSSQ